MKTVFEAYQGAERLENVHFSAIRTVLDKAAKLRSEGHRVIPLSAGEPNFNTPEPIKQATIKALENNFTHYGSNRGLPKLREILAQMVKEETGVSYDPATEILITCGGAEALNNAILSVVDKGDEVIVFTPAFVTYQNLVAMCEGVCVELPLKPENDFQIDLKELEEAITDKTKMIILNNPNNPTGAVYSEESLAGLCKLAVEHDIFVLSDEMYSKLLYEGKKFCSIAQFPGMKEHSIIVNGFSKTYAMTGWRVGYILADEKVLTPIMKVHQYSSTCCPTFIHVGMAEAILLPETQKCVEEMLAEFAERREILLEGLSKIEKLSYVKPYGAFYVMIDVSATGLDGEQFAARLLEEKKVATVPAVALGKECVNYIRVSFAASEDDIREGLKRIEEFIEELISPEDRPTCRAQSE